MKYKFYFNFIKVKYKMMMLKKQLIKKIKNKCYKIKKKNY